MPQPVTAELEARDTTAQGPEAVAERGTGATATFPGVTPIQDSELEKIFATILEDADRYRRPFASEWLTLYAQYNGRIDQQDKAEWQSKINIPKAKQAVDLSTARVMDALFSNEDFFDIYPYISSDDSKVDTAKKMIKWQLWKSSYREPLKTAIKDGFICGFGPLKVTFESDSKPITAVQPDPMTGLMSFTTIEEARKRLRLDPIMPTDCWLDPSGRNRFVIHRVKRSISDLWGMAQDTPERPAVYDATKVAEVKPGATDPTRESEETVIRRDFRDPTRDMAVDVYEYWGDLYDPKNGAVLYRNIVATFANKKTVIRRPQGNPFRHGTSPFIVFAPQLSPHQIYGFGLLGPGALIHQAYNKAWNLTLDKQLFQMPMTQMVPGALKNPDEATQDHVKIVPGKVWQIKDAERPAFLPVEGFQPPTDTDMLINQSLGALYDQSTGVNEFATGTPQTDNRKTKEEVQARTQATAQTFNDSAQHIEESALSPFIKMVYYLMVQFEDDYTDDNLLRQFGDEKQAQVIMALKSMPPEARWQYMYLDAEFRVTGVSLAITRQDRISRLANFKQMVANDPMLNMFLNKQEELRTWLHLFDLPQQMILDNSGMMLQLMQQSQLMQMGLLPGAPGGNAGQNANNQQQAGAADSRAAAKKETGPEKSQEQRPQ